MTYYHGQVRGPAGQLYQCEHNHRTETAALTCSNSSSTRQMANFVWRRAAAQAAGAAAQAKRREEERAAAQAHRIAAQAAEAVAQAKRREEERAATAARQAAAEQAKAAKRAAKLAAMSPERAWKRMTPDERLLKVAEAELDIYGEILTPDAQAAYYDAHGASRPAVKAAQPPQASPGRSSGPPNHEAGLPDWLQSWLPG